MKQTGQCPKCGGTAIISDARAVDRGHGNSDRELTVATFRKPDALLFKERQQTTLSAWVCVTCGYVEFYADNPRAIDLPEG